jgi:hypothetical protein
VYLSGGAAALEGLDTFLAERLRTEVVPLEPLRKVSLGGLPSSEMKPLEGRYSAFAVPLGLALARLAPSAAKLDLRTAEAKARRDFRRRGLFLWAASFAFAAGLVFWIADAARERWVYAAASERAAELEKSDATVLAALDEARGENLRLNAELGALRERMKSGEDLLRALSQLKKRTPPSIQLVEVSTTRPEELGREEDAPDREITFQDQRMIYLRGYSRSRRSSADAMREVLGYQDALEEAKELFEEIRQVDLQEKEIDEPGAPDVAYFVLAIRIAKPK